MEYIASEGERLDSIFFKHYGNDFNQKAYDEFMMANYYLLLKDILNAGDIVIIPEIKPIEQEETKGLYGINL